MKELKLKEKNWIKYIRDLFQINLINFNTILLRKLKKY